ncbi:MAG: hypothetical protein JW982_08685 [Spirochaetes bacterium]|nr:hypothetical protein [Spirochaetota bacterium]
MKEKENVVDMLSYRYEKMLKEAGFDIGKDDNDKIKAVFKIKKNNI